MTPLLKYSHAVPLYRCKTYNLRITIFLSIKVKKFILLLQAGANKVKLHYVIELDHLTPKRTYTNSILSGHRFVSYRKVHFSGFLVPLSVLISPR